MTKPIIVLDKVSKYFNLNKGSTIRQKISFGNSRKSLRFKALDGISLEVYPGETLGLWGPNGGGKTTLMKLIAGIYLPDKGKVEVKGRVAAVLELGVGLHPELTGRENIYFYSSILGIGKENVDRNLPEMIDFFEFPKFIDEPVKHYSTGMKARLAFSIAVFSDAEILLMDEVLSVGDEKFKDKALMKVKQLKGSRTIVFTSHSLTLMQQICDRMVDVRQGKLTNHTRSIQNEFLRNLREGMEIVAEATTSSMEPKIMAGDKITIKKIPYNDLVRGDIVAFLFPNVNEMIVHRIVSIEKSRQGELICFTKGDNVFEKDPWILSKHEYVGKVVNVEVQH